MIRTLVKSAFQTGCLSVASEGLIRQVLVMKGYQSADLEALDTLHQALNAGKIQREARQSVALISPRIQALRPFFDNYKAS
jgi:hypothetical protein